MTIEEGLVAFLKADAGITAKVAGRIYQKKKPQKPNLPAIVIHRISANRDYDQGGHNGYTVVRYQLDTYAADFAAAKQTADAVRLALSGFRGSMGGVEVSGVFLEGEQDGYDDDLVEYWFTQDYIIQHAEATS